MHTHRKEISILAFNSHACFATFDTSGDVFKFIIHRGWRCCLLDRCRLISWFSSFITTKEVAQGTLTTATANTTTHLTGVFQNQLLCKVGLNSVKSSGPKKLKHHNKL
jgi:hypothetical protein